MSRIVEQLRPSATVHGFRSSFKDWAHGLPRDSSRACSCAQSRQAALESDIEAMRARISHEWTSRLRDDPKNQANALCLRSSRTRLTASPFNSGEGPRCARSASFDQLQEQLWSEQAQNRFDLTEKDRELAIALRELPRGATSSRGATASKPSPARRVRTQCCIEVPPKTVWAMPARLGCVQIHSRSALPLN
jgi:hypothetical protein